MLRVRRLTASVVVFSSAVVLPWLWPAAAQQSAVTIEASGTGFRVTLPDGSVKQGMELAGAVLTFNIDGKPVRVRAVRPGGKLFLPVYRKPRPF